MEKAPTKASRFHIYLPCKGTRHSVLIVSAFNQEKILVEAFSVIVKSLRTFV